MNFESMLMDAWTIVLAVIGAFILVSNALTAISSSGRRPPLPAPAGDQWSDDELQRAYDDHLVGRMSLEELKERIAERFEEVEERETEEPDEEMIEIMEEHR